MYGGFSGYLQETWEYDGKTWTQITSATQPPGRYGGDFMAYDSRRQVCVIFGGITTTLNPRQANDTWEYPAPALVGTPPTVSIASGGTHSLLVDAGTMNANKLYWIFGSLTGTSPGVTLFSPTATVTIPLVPDLYTNLTIALPNVGPFVATKGTLDAQGQNTAAKLVVPVINDQNAIGLVFYHAFLVYDANNNFYMASNPATLQLVK